MALLLHITIGVVGLGILGPILRRWAFPNLSEFQSYTISAALVVGLIVLAHQVGAYPETARHLANWQRDALAADCRKWNLKTMYVGSAPTLTEPEDYSRELMGIFSNICHLQAAYGYDPFPNAIVVNQKAIVVASSENALLRVIGLQIWIPDLDHKPAGAVALAEALDRAGIPSTWRIDLRLKGIAAFDEVRVPITEPECILLVGKKPSLSLSAYWLYESRHFSWSMTTLRKWWSAR